MAKPRKEENPRTTISISWEDKKTLRKYASKVKDSKSGTIYENDSVVFAKILKYYAEHNTGGQITTTYPSKTPNKPQPDSNHVLST